MAEAVDVDPSTGSLETMACAGVNCLAPPKGMRTVEAPMVESKRSASPLLEHTLISARSSLYRDSSDPGWSQGVR